jgi:N-acetylglucosamine kinase-like BadF-type ATPase
VTQPIVLAVDGGNSKTDLALARADGRVLAFVRGPMSSPHHLGIDGALAVLEDLFEHAVEDANLNRDGRPLARVGHLLMAGIDFPNEERKFQRLVAARAWAEQVSVDNDTFAVLRAGTQRGWGVAVVCGAGINCVGVASDGRHARFPALGAITGDWGGGYDLGLAAVSAAARSEDGRGAKTTLEEAVPRHFRVSTPTELAESIHTGRIPMRRVIELAPVVLAEAATDAAAGEIVDRLVEEVVALVRVALTRLELTAEPVEVLLGGGVLQNADERIVGAIVAGLRDVAPLVEVRTTKSPAIVGAALLGLDEVAATPEAEARLRQELEDAVSEIGAAAAAVGAGPTAGRPTDG